VRAAVFLSGERHAGEPAMQRKRASRFRPARRGVILIVVLAMLTLFALVGITFVYVATAQADSARIAREGENQTKGDLDPEGAFALFFSQFIYGVSDTDGIGIYSGLRGQDLARNMYGGNLGSPADRPFTGTGRVHFTPKDGIGRNNLLADLSKPNWNDLAYLMNHTYWRGDQILLDPERQPRVVNDALGAGPAAWADLSAATKQGVMGAWNAPYTYPDHNNFFLGMLVQTNDPTQNPPVVPNGMIMVPSFHRDYLFGSLSDFDPTPTIATSPYSKNPAYNVNWHNKIGKYLTLRPRPVDHLQFNDVANDPVLGPIARKSWPLPLDQIVQAPILHQALFNLIQTLQRAGRLFPYPQDSNGDVKNLDGVGGVSDSLWLDINAPILVTADGRRYKMLVAPLILELDSRLNLNVVGNLMSQASLNGGAVHRSNQGWGVWEINPGPIKNAASLQLLQQNPIPMAATQLPFAGVLNGPNTMVATANGNNVTANPAPTEWRNIFWGSDSQYKPPLVAGQAVPARIPGRYDNATGTPTNPNPRLPLAQSQPAAVFNVRGWAQIDFDGLDNSNGGPSAAFTVQGVNGGQYPIPSALSNLATGDVPYIGIPFFPPNTYADGRGPTYNELNNHAMMYGAFRPYQTNRSLPLSGMAQLLRFKSTGSDVRTSDVMRLLPQNLIGTGFLNPDAARRRNLVTLHSCDLDRPGATPYMWNFGNTDPTKGPLALTLSQSGPNGAWTINGVPGDNKTTPLPWTIPPTTTSPPNASEFDPQTWRYFPKDNNGNPIIAALNRINLNRPLTNFPNLATGTMLNTTTNSGNVRQARRAIAERQQFAKDIYDALRVATGAMDPDQAYAPKLANTMVPIPPETTIAPQFSALRYLAQLAVNIVDYIDTDGYSTPFNWYTYTPPAGGAPKREWVFGVETPRAVLNETYIQFDNDNTALVGNGMVSPTANYNINVWAELMNPLPNDSGINGLNDSNVALQNQFPNGSTLPAGSNLAYRILLRQSQNMSDPTQSIANSLADVTNVTGDPDFNPKDPNNPFTRWGNTQTSWVNNANGRVVLNSEPATNRFDNPGSFYVIGPQVTYRTGANNPNFRKRNPNNPGGPPIAATNFLSPQMTYAINAGTADPPKIMGAPNPANPVGDGTFITNPIVIMLQRLANTMLPFDNNQASPTYNPYITVDYVVHKNTPSNPATNPPTYQSPILVWDGRDKKISGPNTPAASPAYTGDGTNQNMTARYTAGRNQPLTANPTVILAQTPKPPVPPLSTPPPTMPQNTFARQNSYAPNTATAGGVTGLNDESVANPDQEIPPGGTLPMLKRPFDWLVHLDRPPISTLELLNTTWCKPHELTQQFMNVTNGGPNAHVAPWLDQNSRLYRFLELAQAATGRGYGIVAGGRTPGKININMNFSDDIFFALCDAQGPGNRTGSFDWRFNQQDVESLWTTLLNKRSPGATYTAATTGGTLAKTVVTKINPTDPQLAALAGNASALDRPFWSLSMGQGPGVDDAFAKTTIPVRGIDSGFLRGNNGQGYTGANSSFTANPATLGGLSAPSQSGSTNLTLYQRNELLRKIFNNVTTRSNVFAVWLTVGYFEVAKDANGNYTDTQTQPLIGLGQLRGSYSRPVLLGQELGKSENRHIRHRMFAVIDRTNLQLWPTLYPNNPSAPSMRSVAAIPAPSNNRPVVTVTVHLQNAAPPQAANPDPRAYRWQNLTNNQGVIQFTGTNQNAYTNPFTGYAWTPQAGAVLVFDPDTDNEETVVLQKVPNSNPAAYQATFTKAHAANCVVISRGNPGPWAPITGNTVAPPFMLHPSVTDPRLDSGIVPYFAVIH
jgi:hypothetical protein